MNIFFIILFILALSLSLILTPIVMRRAIKKGFVDKPDERKLQKVPIAYGGGIAIFLSFLIVSFIGIGLILIYKINLPQRDWYIIAAFLLGGTLSALIGFIDDWKSMPAKVKLICQIVTILLVMPLGVSITFITNPFGESLIYLPRWLGIALTLFWMVGLMNAVNLIDGLDGLLGGVTFISSIVFIIVALMKGYFFVAGVMFILAGSVLGFLKYNFNPAKIFMGDTGSLFIGMIFAIISVIGGLKTTTAFALLIPFLILGLPIVDTAWAIIRRVKNNQPIFKPDKEHIHHRLLAIGLNQKQAVCIIYAINILLGLIAIAICHYTRI